MPAGPERVFHESLSGDLFDYTCQVCEEKEDEELDLKWELVDLEVRLGNRQNITESIPTR